MSRGKKTSPERIYAVMASWAITGSFKETSRELGIPVSTVKSIVDANKDKPEFVKLREEKKNDFSEMASIIIDKGLNLLKKRFERALEQEENLDVLIDEIFATSKEELSHDEKTKLVSKIRALQLQDVRAITTAIGTLFDKRALTEGNATQRLSVEVKLPDEADEYAG